MKKVIYIVAGIIIILAGVFMTGSYYYRSVDYKKVLVDHKSDATLDHMLESHIEEIDTGEKQSTSEETTDKNSVEISEPDVINSDQGNRIQENLINILFLGLDRTEERDETLGVYRTDSISLASINLDTLDVKILSIPRDTYVYIPVKKKMDKINHAYVWGGSGDEGIKSSIETINRFIKYSSVDYYFTIDMEPIPDIVDDLRGVELEVDVDMKTHGYNLSKGLQKLNGEQALQFIRWRYSGGGDLDRIKRQQTLVGAMLSKLKESEKLIESIGVVLKYKKYIKTNMDSKQIAALAKLWNDMPEEKEPQYYTVTGDGKIIDNVWYMIPDKKITDTALKEIFNN